MPDEREDTVPAAVLAVARWLPALSPGPLADLRRMDPGNPAAAFWRLASRYPATVGRDERSWAHIVRMLALLAPRGDPGAAREAPLHHPRRRLGAVLCDGGRRGWPAPGPEEPRPALSEVRLARLLASRGDQRPVLLLRALRALARTMDPGSGVNAVDIAYAVLRPAATAGIARAYYGRLDGARTPTDETEGNPA